MDEQTRRIAGYVQMNSKHLCTYAKIVHSLGSLGDLKAVVPVNSDTSIGKYLWLLALILVEVQTQI